MRHRIPLPDSLGAQFSVADAEAAGLGRGRIQARDLARPFHAVRARDMPTRPHQRVQMLTPRLRPGQRIGGRTALHIWGYPYPDRWSVTDDVDVVVSTDAVRPRTRGVRAFRLARGRAQDWQVDGIPIIDPIAALFMCAKDLTDTQIVAVIDALLTTADNYPGLIAGRPISTALEIADRLRAWGRFPGCRRVRDALTKAREGVESPKETETRLLIIAAGLAEPAVQHDVIVQGRLIARVDLAYPELKIAIEYEGDGHRTDKRQWRRDIQRQRELEDLGWIVIRVTELDLRDGGAQLLRRIRNAIASR